MRVSRLLITLVCLGVNPLLGCGSRHVVETPEIGAVAVIDLDAVAARLGSDKQIVQAMAERKTTLNQQLVDLSKSYVDQIEQRKKTLDEAQRTDVALASWQQQANANLAKVKQQAELDLQRHQAELVAQFRQQIKPTARKVAQSRGLSVIVTKNDGVLYDFAPAVDITEEVIAELVAVPVPGVASQAPMAPAGSTTDRHAAAPAKTATK
ncbi:MAG: hypothetical protein DCC67_08255 [Planctomycetota bacterium]|nr:MAG: hypothetical protein DCC67_08255 [Planctomycetota bacterium]